MGNAITSANVPQPARVKIDPNDPYPGIVARPLGMPDFINIKPRNPGISLRFVNRVGGNGQRQDQMVYAGFVFAKPEECVMANGQPIVPSLVTDGKIIYGDLVCMKIDRKIYEGALKYNHGRAVDRLHPKSPLKTGRQEIAKAMNESGASRIPNLQSKIQAFQPSEAEIAASEAQEDKS